LNFSNELGWIVQHLLGLRPGVILLFTLFEDQNSLGDLFTGIRWLGKSLELLNALYFKAVNSRLSSLHGRDSFSEFAVSLCLLSLGLQRQNILPPILGVQRQHHERKEKTNHGLHPRNSYLSLKQLQQNSQLLAFPMKLPAFLHRAKISSK